MTASTKKSSSTTRKETLPKTPDAARRHYLTQVVRHRTALAEARATGADDATLAEIAEALADAKEMAGRARAWGRRCAARAPSFQSRGQTTVRRKRQLARVKPLTARDTDITLATRAVPDPYDPKQRITVEVNRQVDILARERAAENIGEAEFIVGRVCQEAWERHSAARLGSAGWDRGGTRNSMDAHELKIAYAIKDAVSVQQFNEEVARAIGWTGLAVLRRFLAEGHTFKGYAGPGANERAISKVAEHFRRILENLTAALYTARGLDRAGTRSARS